MNPRRVSALLCAAGAVLIAWAVLSPSWWRGRIETPTATADLKIGLVSLTGCTHDAAGVWRCESADWKRIGVTPDSALWVWSGRLLFGVGVAAAIGMALTALLAGVPIEATLPISPQRLTIAFVLAALALLGLYRVSTPEAISVLLGSGRSWWVSALGLVIGGVGIYRELRAAAD
jgi:hypothetical protein